LPARLRDHAERGAEHNVRRERGAPASRSELVTRAEEISACGVALDERVQRDAVT
jgi:hypothetical protein